LSAVLREGRLTDGERMSRSAYRDALREAGELRARLAQAFEAVDILIAWSLAGNPVITLPLFTASASGLPIGCQFIADLGADDLLLSASKSTMTLFGPAAV
jgi:Asp-tRNA(Asn)/Glu-tRNA(Gln) amidotransferase A subunit family amidase